MAFMTPPLSPFLFPASGSPPPPSSLPPPFCLQRRRSVAFSFPNPFSSKPRTIEFGSIGTIGRRALPESVVFQHLRPLQNQRVVLQKVQDAVDSINKWLVENGYVCSQVVLPKSPVSDHGTLTLFCIEPLLSGIELNAVDKDGNADSYSSISTRPGTIYNALGVRPGDVFVWRASGLAQLMALGLFEYANADVKILSNEKVSLILQLCERPSGRLEPGAGITSDGRMYGDISLVDNNFMGRAQRLRLEWQKRVDVPRSAGNFSFEDMRVGAYIPLSFRLRAYRDTNAGQTVPSGPVNEDGDGQDGSGDTNNNSGPRTRYEKDRDGVLFDIGYRPYRSKILLNLTPMFEHVYPNSADSNGSSLLQVALQTGFTHATRRPVELPRSGHIFRVEHFFGSPLRDSPDIFHRVKLKITNYVGLAGRSSVVARIILGFGSNNLPWHEQRSLGGQGTVRGYNYGQLGRYKSYGTGRIEVRVPLAFTREDSEVKNNTRSGGDEVTKEKVEIGNDRGDIESKVSGSMIPTGLFDRLPTLVGVLFGDAAVTSVDNSIVGAAFGLGLRIGGIIAVDWTSTMNGPGPRVHFSLVDQNL